MSPRGAAVLLSAALGAACGPPPTPPSSGAVTLGTIDPRRHGDARWVDIQDGQDAELAPGAQGGYHIWLRYRVEGLSGRVHVVRLTERLLGERRDRVLTTDSYLEIPAERAARWEPEDPIPNFACPTPIGIGVIDQLLEMIVRVEPADGSTPAEGRARVTARCPPEGDPQRPYCLEICKG